MFHITGSVRTFINCTMPIGRKFVMPKLSEHQIRNQIIDLLNNNGYYAWTNNTGGFTQEHTDKKGITRRHHVRFGRPGFSDIFAVQKGTGRFVCIEVKTPERKNNTTQWQEDFLTVMRMQGAIAMVAWSMDMVASELGISI